MSRIKPDVEISDSSDAPKVVKVLGLVRVRAKAGIVQPISYKGSIIFIGEKETVEFDLSALSYQSRAQIDRALLDGELLEVGE